MRDVLSGVFVAAGVGTGAVTWGGGGFSSAIESVRCVGASGVASASSRRTPNIASCVQQQHDAQHDSAAA